MSMSIISPRRLLLSPLLRTTIKFELSIQRTRAAGNCRLVGMATMAGDQASAPKYSYHPPRPRRFAPLKNEGDRGEGEEEGKERLPRLKGIVFDVDGTLCLPQNYMFKQMREALQIPKSIDILEHIRTLSDRPDGESSTTADSSADGDQSGPSSPRSRAVDAIQSIERKAMTSQTPQPGLVELMTYLSSRHVPVGLCTRNFPAPVQHLVENFLTPNGVSFEEEEIVTRDTKGIEPKPSPEGIWKIARYWVEKQAREGKGGLDEVGSDQKRIDVLDAARKYLGSGLIMVGDSVDDMAAGYRAGAATVLLLSEDNESLKDHEYTDLTVRRLDELIAILEDGFVGNVSM